jgi:hypothetical protein
VFRVTADYSEAELLLGQSLAVFTEIGSKRNVADASIELATLHRMTGDLDKARPEAVLALEIYQEIRNVRGAAWAELELSVIERLGRPPSSIRRLERLPPLRTRRVSRSSSGTSAIRIRLMRCRRRVKFKCCCHAGQIILLCGGRDGNRRRQVGKTARTPPPTRLGEQSLHRSGDWPVRVARCHHQM